MGTFLKALEEVYLVEPEDRFMETGSIWQAICLDLGRDLGVDPADMAKLSEKYVVEKKLLHPIKEGDMYRTLKNLLYYFIARDYQRNANIDQFLLICEKLIYKWQQVQFQYDFRNDKRAPMATEVGEHCEGCGKPNHQRKGCTSGHDPKHPDFNEEGRWVGCANYKTIKLWLASQNRAGEHPTLRFNFRAKAKSKAGSTIRKRLQV